MKADCYEIYEQKKLRRDMFSSKIMIAWFSFLWAAMLIGYSSDFLDEPIGGYIYGWFCFFVVWLHIRLFPSDVFRVVPSSGTEANTAISSLPPEQAIDGKPPQQTEGA